MFWLSFGLIIVSIGLPFLALASKGLAPIAAIGSFLAQLAGSIICIVGLAWYARSKGQSKWLGTLGLLGWLGWLIVKYAIRDEWLVGMDPVATGPTPYPRGQEPAFELETWGAESVVAPQSAPAPPVTVPPMAPQAVQAQPAPAPAPQRPPTPVDDHPLRKPALAERAASANASW